MPYIYKIINDINNKIYIGKTQYSIEKRFDEHCKDAFRLHEEKRPLYAAMRKYGVEHFSIEVIEETDQPEEREKYWIEYYGSFKYGYNATRGGDGKHYADYDLIFSLWNEGKNIKEIATILNYDAKTIRIALTTKGITTEQRKLRGLEKTSRIVAKIDKDTDEIIEVFSSLGKAAESINKPTRHINEVCLGKRRTAYGYKWKYLS